MGDEQVESDGVTGEQEKDVVELGSDISNLVQSFKNTALRQNPQKGCHQNFDSRISQGPLHCRDSRLSKIDVSI